MERSDSLIKFVSIVVLAALAIYIGISVYRSKTDPFQSVEAVTFELDESIPSQGYAVRQESLIKASGNVAVIISDGGKVSSGQTVAFKYNGSRAMERAQEINSLRMRIQQLEAARSGKSGQEMAQESLLALSGAMASGDLAEIYSIAQNVETYIIAQEDVGALDVDGQIQGLQEQLQSLMAQSASDTDLITAPFDGTFTSAVDGLEGVSPEDLAGLAPGELEDMFSSPSDTGGAIGKLIQGITWYYAAIVDEDATVWLSPGERVRLDFQRTYSESLDMTVESVGESQNGKCVVVFSCDRFMQDVASLREMSATIVFESLSGIRVPKEAVHVDEEGGTYVYILEGLQASQVYVDIIGESGEYYMAQETGQGLRAGDQIITRANGLYDGAVVLACPERI